jgi:hypothetical protein
LRLRDVMIRGRDFGYAQHLTLVTPSSPSNTAVRANEPST